MWLVPRPEHKASLEEGEESCVFWVLVVIFCYGLFNGTYTGVCVFTRLNVVKIWRNFLQAAVEDFWHLYCCVCCENFGVGIHWVSLYLCLISIFISLISHLCQMGIYSSKRICGFNFFLGLLMLWPNGWRRKVLGAFSVFG
jgi:hypothetical protein